MNDSYPVHDPSILDVQLAFEHWRLERTSCREATPSHLQALAITLLKQHNPFTICKALGVNSKILKRWAMGDGRWAMDDSSDEHQFDFVALPDAAEAIATRVTSTDPTLLIRLPNGVEINIMSGFSLTHVLSVASSLRATP